MAWSKEWKPTLTAKDTIDIDDVKRAHNVFVGIQDAIEIKGNKIPVTIIGDLALEYDDDGWNIHHVPTLSKFNSAVPGYGKVKINWSKEEVEPCYEYDKQPLLNWMKKVQEPSDGCYEFNRYTITGAYIRKAWVELRCLTPENYKDTGQSAKDIIQQWCLSVKVE